jgi:chromosome segregation ATPase
VFSLQNVEAKKATDQLLTTVIGLVASKSKGAVEQYNDMLQENKLASLEFDAYKTTTQSDIARKNTEILALQESLSQANAVNAKADKVLQQVKESSASSRKELIQEYENKMQEFRAENASSASMKRQLEKAKTSVMDLEKRYNTSEDKNIELNGSLECLKSDLIALEKINHNLTETIKKMTNQASKNDFADTFEEVMREEMMAMKGAFEAKLKIARQQTEAMSRKRQSEISRIESSRSTGGLR